VAQGKPNAESWVWSRLKRYDSGVIATEWLSFMELFKVKEVSTLQQLTYL